MWCLRSARVRRKLDDRVFAIVASYFVTGGDKQVLKTAGNVESIAANPVS
jgi:hypothetical protein